MGLRLLGRSVSFGLSLGASVALNGLIFYGLAHMNTPKTIVAPEAPGPALFARIDPRVELEKEEPKEIEEEEYEPEDEEVDLEMEMPQETVSHEAMETPIDMSVPAMSSVMVARQVLRDPTAKTVDIRKSSGPVKARPVKRPVIRRGPRRADKVERPPREHSSNRKPKYPRALERRRRSGSVDVALLIDEAGFVKKAKVLRVSGSDSFGKAVLAAVQEWRFDPAWHQGRYVSVWAKKTIRFMPKR
ncbi:MAG: energy transducer TonB [Planctomycetota bacterium]|nr:energy transducer TonB [Planctomycetota bacterium]